MPSSEYESVTFYIKLCLVTFIAGVIIAIGLRILGLI